jgi:thiamine biosynthesis lipoprotein
LAGSVRARMSAGYELVAREVFLMGTRGVLSTWSESRAAGLQELERLLKALEDTDAQLSTWRPDSEVSKLNAAAGGDASVLSPSLCEVMKTLDRWTRETERAFDAAIGALADAWDLHGRGRVPTGDALETALRRSGWHRLSFDANECSLRMPKGVSIDVGGFGKGDALDRARHAAGPDSTWMIDLGGQIAIAGAPPDAAAWQISVAHPSRRDTPALRLQLSNGSLATSAGSERDLRVGRQRIGHILDPRTGRPAAFRGSTTVWHEQALVADVLSTALFVMGPEEGVGWANARGIAVVYLLPRSRGAVTTRASRAFTKRFGALTF